jgi:tRNA(fMet)-specific endonuclease VapC
MYLLDTNVVSDFIKGRHEHLLDRMRGEMFRHAVAISTITLAEIRYGQARMSMDDKRRSRIDRLLAQLPTLDWTVAAAEAYGTLKNHLTSTGRPIGEIDTQIAAHALAAGLTLVTHNSRHFEAVPGLKWEDWMA